MSMSLSPGSSSAKSGWLGKLFSGKPKQGEKQLSGSEGAVFGVALHESLKYASVAISQVGPDGKARIYGHIPVVVAKAGLFLKENGTTTPGIFRVSGSNKRIKDLELIFDTAPTYGKDLIWDSYSVHDAASAFRRYLNMLPFPIIPFELYVAFQDALPRASTPPTEAQINTAIERYRVLINSLPPSSQHIFFYTLDLLSVFHRNADQNLMPASNLSMIFQPGLLRHPPAAAASRAAVPVNEGSPDPDAVKAQVEADATEHRKSQEVLVFLIEHQDAFELELPKNLRKATSSAATASSAVPSASTAPARPEAARSTSTTEDEALSDKAAVGRKGSGAKRLRRKSQKPEVMGTKPVPTVDSSDATDRDRRNTGASSQSRPLTEPRRPEQEHSPSASRPPPAPAS